MFHTVDFYYFSPTGGTKKVGESFCTAISENIQKIDLGSNSEECEKTMSDLVVVAAPVFGGRIPSVVTDKLKTLDGNGKKAVVLAVYGNRAYEDALLELTNTMKESGFQVAAGGAFIAQHSMVPEVAKGRPDEKDILEIRDFAKKVLDKIENNTEMAVQIPGNNPYKESMKVSATPVCLPSCSNCGKCAEACPTGAIQIENGSMVTKLEKCILCMACVDACPQQARMLPTPLQEAMNQKLGALKTVYRENEIFL